MSYFIHKDNTIEIDEYRFHENILKTFDPTYTKPDGWTRCYIQGRKHYLSNGKIQTGDEFPWVRGDMYIKSIIQLQLLEKQLILDKEYSVSEIE